MSSRRRTRSPSASAASTTSSRVARGPADAMPRTGARSPGAAPAVPVRRLAAPEPVDLRAAALRSFALAGGRLGEVVDEDFDRFLAMAGSLMMREARAAREVEWL